MNLQWHQCKSDLVHLRLLENYKIVLKHFFYYSFTYDIRYLQNVSNISVLNSEIIGSFAFFGQINYYLVRNFWIFALESLQTGKLTLISRMSCTIKDETSILRPNLTRFLIMIAAEAVSLVYYIKK